MSFINRFLGWLTGGSGQTSSDTSAIKTVSPAPNSFKSENYAKKRNALAKLCKMGDASAMYGMACLILENLPFEPRDLILAYESDPCKETQSALWTYMDCHRASSEPNYYMMWMIRAALYGNEKAATVIESCYIYKILAFIPYKLYVSTPTAEPFWSSEMFYDAGFCDIIRKKEDCGLVIHKKLGYIEFYYVSDYEPPDEDGFGSETTYESVYYDEFFKRLPICSNATADDIHQALKKAEAEREAYWKGQADRDERKHNRTLKDFTK